MTTPVKVLSDASGSATWAFVLEPIDETHTRLITRVRAGYERFALGLVIELVWRPIHFGMQRQQLLNLKRRVETARRCVGVDVSGHPGPSRALHVAVDGCLRSSRG